MGLSQIARGQGSISRPRMEYLEVLHQVSSTGYFWNRDGVVYEVLCLFVYLRVVYLREQKGLRARAVYRYNFMRKARARSVIFIAIWRFSPTVMI